MNKFFISLISILFMGMAVVFATFPRSTYSELERRELAKFPTWSLDSLLGGTFTSQVNQWFSDSEPYREQLMTLSMTLKQYTALHLGKDEEAIVFHASDDADAASPAEEAIDDQRDIADYHNDMANENAKMATRGIILIGSGPNVRALSAYGGTGNGGGNYAEAANKYKEAFGNSVNVYVMVIPTSTEFYLPDNARKFSNPQLPTIRNIYNHLRPDVKAVDAYTPLSQHVKEDIYLRTDHHWAPLGAYYAAQQFARVAGVPFKDLSNYDRKVVHGYVGSMYGYSHDIAVKNAPEDFVYYTPRDIQYTTTYINYKVNEKFQVTGENNPMQGQYFYKYPDGSGGAYCTFMGGDTKITQVRTGTRNGRRLVILKDSFGNAVPGYLFYSFEEIHVVDCRYFNKNMRRYVADNRITDILFAHNIYNVYGSMANKAVRFLDQANGYIAPVTSTPAAPSAKPAPPKPAPKTEAKPKQDTTTEPIPAPKAEPKPEPKPEPKVEPKADPEPAPAE